MDGEPAAMGEGDGAVRAVVTHLDCPGAIVNGAVVMAAQQQTICEIGGATLLPCKDVVGMCPRRRAARKAASAVAGPQGRALPGVKKRWERPTSRTTPDRSWMTRTRVGLQLSWSKSGPAIGLLSGKLAGRHLAAGPPAGAGKPAGSGAEGSKPCTVPWACPPPCATFEESRDGSAGRKASGGVVMRMRGLSAPKTGSWCDCAATWSASSNASWRR